MKPPFFSGLGVQILLLGEKYQQEFGNGKRHLLYNQKDHCKGFTGVNKSFLISSVT